MENSQTVAMVNGKEIKRKDLDLQMQRIAKVQQVTIPDKRTEEGKKFEQDALNYMVNDILLVQDAKNQGFQATKEEVDSHYSALASQAGGDEKLEQALQSMGITADHLREDLANQLIIESHLNFIKEKNEITVTEEEVKDFYEKKVALQDPGVEFKAVEPQIYQMIEQQKLNQPLSEIIQNLRKEADIKNFL